MFKWLYKFLFIESATGKVSHSKFFSVVGYVIMCWAFVYGMVYDAKLAYEYWVLFGVVVIGNKTLKKAIELKNKEQ